jgi:simple sugar transport system substrate-binding protein
VFYVFLILRKGEFLKMKYFVGKKLIVILIILCFSLLLAGNVNAEQQEIAVVVKISGIPFYNVFEEGVKQAAKELNVNAYQLGSVEFDPAQQVKIVEDLIAKGVDAICITPIDPAGLDPVFKRAKEKGITIITQESKYSDYIDWDTSVITFSTYATTVFEKLAELMGGKGEYAILVGSLESPIYNICSDVGEKFIKEKYPEMKLVTSRIPCAESIDLSITRTDELLKAYPNLKGIVSIGTLGPIGAAEALKKKNLGGKVINVGTVIPSQADSYLKENLIQFGILFDPRYGGYSLVSVAKKVLDGEEIKDGMIFPELGAAKVDPANKSIIFDKLLIITAENAAKLGF